MAGPQRLLLYHMRSTIVQPFNETALRVFARVSALRDSLDGAQVLAWIAVNSTSLYTFCKLFDYQVLTLHHDSLSHMLPLRNTGV